MAPGDRRLPDSKREYFKKPLGKDIAENELSELSKEHMLITVGDVVSLTVWKNGIVPDVSIYDGMTERREMTDFAVFVKDEGLEEAVVENAPGMITGSLFDAVRNALTGHNKIIRVNGEEDLATIPCILLAPDGTNIIYGWPGKGMKIVTTDDSTRNEAKLLIGMMEELE
jgi:GTP-dependent dephospho-CoA kinase